MMHREENDMTFTRKLAAPIMAAAALSLALVGCGTATDDAGISASSTEVASIGSDGTGGRDAADQGSSASKGTNDIATTAGIWVPTRVTLRRDIGDGTRWLTKETTYKVDDDGNLLGIDVMEDGSDEDARGSEEIVVLSDADGFVTSLAFTDPDGDSEQKDVEFLHDIDADGRVTQIEARPDPSHSRLYALSYGEGGELSEVAGSELTLSFDEEGHLVSEVEIGTILPSVDGEYRYDYAYGDDGQLERITRSYPGRLGIGTETADAEFECDGEGNLSKTVLEIPGSKVTTTYEYTYVANPSAGARLYWHGPMWLLTQL